jgi:hypothetical protein
LKTLEVFIRSPTYASSPGQAKLGMVGRQGFEPWKPMATDLQSAPFGHLGTCPKHFHMTQQFLNASLDNCLFHSSL